MARAKPIKRHPPEEADGFWDRPALMNMAADLFFLFAILAFAWATANVVQRLPVFPLKEVVVTSAVERVNPSQLEQTARGALIGNFFTVNLDAMRDAVEKLPWVRRAEVRRRWPDTLEVAIEEHAAMARWLNAENESLLVNRQGEIFSAPIPADRRLPAFSGPEGSASEVLARHGDFDAELAKLGRHATAVTLSARQAWEIKLDDGTVVELGRDQQKHPLAERLTRFVEYYPAARDKLRVTAAVVVDMRYPNGFAMRPARKS